MSNSNTPLDANTEKKRLSDAFAMTKSNDIPIHPIPKIEMIWQADIRQLTKAISGLATALNKYGDVIGTTGDCGQLCAELVDGDECHHKRDERIRQQIRNNLGLK